MLTDRDTFCCACIRRRLDSVVAVTLTYMTSICRVLATATLVSRSSLDRSCEGPPTSVTELSCLSQAPKLPIVLLSSVTHLVCLDLHDVLHMHTVRGGLLHVTAGDAHGDGRDTSAHQCLRDRIRWAEGATEQSNSSINVMQMTRGHSAPLPLTRSRCS